MSFPSDLFAGQRFAVVGLGRGGLPAAHALAAMGAEVVGWDDSETARDEAAAGGITLARPSFPGFDALILSPGIPATHPLGVAARAAAVPILCDVEMLYRAVRAAGSRARFVGITGTNGKSTTTALVAHLLRVAKLVVAEGGNLGPPALGLPLLPHDAVYVLEVSSYMLERIADLRFDVAAMLNLSPDHLDRHGDMAGYAAVKRRVFQHQTERDVAVIGVDDEPSRRMADWLQTRSAPVRAISMHAPLPALPASLPGAHNAQNAAAALAITEALGVDARAGLASFAGLPHRMESLGRVDGVAFVNDSKATNAQSAATALSCYERVVWIAGGIAKTGGIESLSEFDRIVHALLIGRDAPLLAATLARHGVGHEIAGTLDAAVPAAFARARAEHATVLLSPACASFDQFANFEARGERFRTLVAQLRAAA